jgi:hypothetical protein
MEADLIPLPVSKQKGEAMKNFLTNLAIKYLRGKDYIILNRAEAAKDKNLFGLITRLFSHIHRWNSNVLSTGNN